MAESRFRVAVRAVALFAAGLLVQNKFHGLSLGRGWWLVSAWVVLSLSLLYLLATEPALRDRRPTLHIGRSTEGGVRIWREAPVKPLLARQRAERADADREIEVGWRAIRVGGEVLAAYQRARASVAAVEAQWGDTSPWGNPGGYQAERRAYDQALNEIKASVGAAWAEVLSDLANLGVRPGSAHEISVNFTGLDSDATQVQAAGRALLRKHGVDPDKGPGETPRGKGFWPFK